MRFYHLANMDLPFFNESFKETGSPFVKSSETGSNSGISLKSETKASNSDICSWISYLPDP